MNKINYIFLLIILNSVCFKSNAQKIPLKQYTTKDGLTHSVVYRTFQDSKGYLWFSTDYGLCRFDGDNFISYTKSDGLSSHYIMTLVESPDSTLWIATYGGGLQRFKNDTIEPYNPKNQKLTPSLIDIKCDSQNRLWVLDLNRKLGFIFKDIYYPFDINKRLSQNLDYKICYVLENKNKNVLIASTQGVLEFDKSNRLSFIHPQLNGIPVFCLEEDNEGNVWCGSKGHIYVLKKNGNLVTINCADPNKEVHVLKFFNNTMWGHAFPDYTFVINSIDENYTINTISNQIGNIPINNLFKDNQQNLWLASYGQGVFKLQANNIVNYFDDLITDIKGDSNFVYVSTKNTIYTFNTSNPNSYETLVTLNGNSVIKSILPQTKSPILISYDNKLYNGNHKPITFFKRVFSLINKNENIVYMATKASIATFHKKEKVIKEIFKQDNFFFYTIVKKSNDTYWLGTNRGVFLLKDDKISLLYNSQNSRLNNDDVYDIYSDANNCTWVATDVGISKLSANNTWDNYPIWDDNKKSVKCNAIKVDKDGMLWIATVKGLYCFDGHTFKKYSSSAIGIAGDEITKLFIDYGNKLWVGTSRGLSIINLDKFKKENPVSFPVYITSLVLNDTTFTSFNNVNLNHYQNSIEINYKAVCLNNTEDLFYEYSLDNVMTKWVKTSNTSVIFAALEPGDYSFKVRAKKMNGLYSNTQTVSFKILPPFWHTWWFYVILGCCSIMVLLVSVKWYLSYFKKKELDKLTVERKLIQLEHQAINSFMAPHFIFNVLNSIHYSLKYMGMAVAEQNLLKFSKLIRLNFESAKKSFNTLEKEIEALKLYLLFEQNRFEEKFSYTIHIEEAIDVENIMIPSILIQPFVENTLWHGFKSNDTHNQLHITITETKNHLLQITIIDNGQGLHKSIKKKSNTHKSSAVKLTQERLNIISKMFKKEAHITITDLSETDPTTHGTKVIIVLPVITLTDSIQ